MTELTTIGPSKGMYLGVPGQFLDSLNEMRPPIGIETFETNEQRIRFALRMARKGCNYFIGFINVAPEQYGLSYAYSDWVEAERGRDGIYVRDVHGLIH